MQELKSKTECRNVNWDGLKVPASARVEFSTANRTVEIDGAEKKFRIVFPVLLPKGDVDISTFFGDLEKLGYDTKAILRNGFVLHFSKLFVPSPDKLVPSKSATKKNMPADFVGKWLASLSPENLQSVVSKPTEITEKAKSAFEENNESGKPADFYFVSDELSDELKRDLNSFFSNEKKNK